MGLMDGGSVYWENHWEMGAIGWEGFLWSRLSHGSRAELRAMVGALGCSFRAFQVRFGGFHDPDGKLGMGTRCRQVMKAKKYVC